MLLDIFDITPNQIPGYATPPPNIPVTTVVLHYPSLSTKNSVTIRNPDDLVFNWPFFGHNLCSVFEWLKQKGRTIPKSDKIVRLLNAIQRLDNSTLGHKLTIQIPD
jgi:hypothetical protein